MFPGFGRERRRRTVWNLFVFVFLPRILLFESFEIDVWWIMVKKS